MSDCMTFPDTVEEFMEQYKIVDTEQVYTNGTELVPIFRMKQWFKHLPSAQPERKKGWWIVCTESFEETFHTGHRCSACNYWKPMGIWNYCPNCGAYMGGDT